VRVHTTLGLNTIFTPTRALASGRPRASSAMPVTTPPSGAGAATRATKVAVTGAWPAALPVTVIG
jgi:hypothetical protein